MTIGLAKTAFASIAGAAAYVSARANGCTKSSRPQFAQAGVLPAVPSKTTSTRARRTMIIRSMISSMPIRARQARGLITLKLYNLTLRAIQGPLGPACGNAQLAAQPAMMCSQLALQADSWFLSK